MVMRARRARGVVLKVRVEERRGERRRVVGRREVRKDIVAVGGWFVDGGEVCGDGGGLVGGCGWYDFS